MLAGKETARSAVRVLMIGAGVVAATGLAVPVASAQTAGSLAGFNLGATSAVVQFELDSPGLLPVGDPSVGNIFAVDMPLARTTAASGPQIDALGSPMYPGDPGAHLGTAVATFGGPELPNDPAVAEADYPPSKTNASKESFTTPGVSNGAFSIGTSSAQSQDSPTGASVDSIVGEIGLGPPIATATNLIHIQSARATNAMHIADSSVASLATSQATGINIAGVIQIASVEGRAGGTSDGNNATPTASLSIGKVTVAGQAAYVDQNGVHLASQGGGGPAVDLANGVLENLGTEGISVHTISPIETTNGPVAEGDSGALVVTLKGATPRIPGAGPLVPGAPPVPGAPSVPFIINILIGNAIASANGSPLPSFNFGSSGLGSGGDFGSAVTPATMTPSGSALTGASGAAPSLAPTNVTIPPTGPGSSANAARHLGNAVLADVGKPIPVGFTVGLLFLALCAAGGLMAYARWQLIDGRHS